VISLPKNQSKRKTISVIPLIILYIVS